MTLQSSSLPDTGKERVRLHFVVLETQRNGGENNFFGDLSLLDTETRSASATTLTHAYLLKIDQEPFYELMENRIEVARGIIRTLCKRLREQNQKSIERR